jgi:AcrR family transcriptional regulator
MAKSKAANQQIRNEQRSKILNAARSVFAREGPGATMDDIAAAAKVSHGLAYRYFPSKSALLQALIEEAIEASPADPLLNPTPGDPDERLRILIGGLIESRRQRPELYLLLDQIRNSEDAPEKFKRKLRMRKEAFLDLLESLIAEGQAKGTVRVGDVGQLAVAIGAVLEGLTLIARNEPRRFRSSCPDPEIVLRMLLAAGVENLVSKQKEKVKR